MRKLKECGLEKVIKSNLEGPWGKQIKYDSNNSSTYDNCVTDDRTINGKY